MLLVLAAEFIRESYYPKWLFNIILVKKLIGKWRICVGESKRQFLTTTHRLDNWLHHEEQHVELYACIVKINLNLHELDEQREDNIHHGSRVVMLLGYAF